MLLTVSAWLWRKETMAAISVLLHHSANVSTVKRQMICCSVYKSSFDPTAALQNLGDLENEAEKVEKLKEHLVTPPISSRGKGEGQERSIFFLGILSPCSKFVEVILRKMGRNSSCLKLPSILKFQAGNLQTS